MLHRPSSLVPTEVQSAPPEASDGHDLSGALIFARRHWPVIAAIFLASIGMAITYLLVTPPLYLGRSSLLLDTRKLQLFQQQSVLSEVSFDAPAVESQIEILKSESIARAVVEELKLTADPEFTGNVASFFGSLSSAVLKLLEPGTVDLLDATSVSAEEELTRSAVGYLRSHLSIQRVRLTYVIEIGFTSRDAGKAARVANAVAEAYIADQTQTKQYTTKRATVWLQERMSELREHAVAADRAVQDFRTKNKIISVGGSSMDEQQISQLTTQLVTAREQTAAAQARLERIREIMASKVPDASMTSWLQNDVMNKLRQQYVDASRRESDYVVRLGKDHQAVINLRKEMMQIEQAAGEELRRIAESFQSDYEIAQAREQATQLRLDQQTRQYAGTRQEQGALQVLESTAKAYQTLHDNFLQRFVETTQQQNVTNTEARVITAAVRAQKVHPKTELILPFASLLGLMMGCGAAYVRERLDAVFRTPKQVEQTLGLECLGVLPAIDAKPSMAGRYTPSSLEIAERIIAQDLGIARQVILTPFSRFTETVRNIKVAADTSSTTRDVRVVGFVSAVPAEGKSTVSANLAQLAAHGGGRTLLIDGDLRNPSLTRTMAPHAQFGLLEILNGDADVSEVVWHDPITGLDFLPSVLTAPIAHTSEILASRKMAELLRQAREVYDYIVIDFPPLAPVVDAKAGSNLVDGFILVIEWGQTSPEIVVEALGSAEVVQSKLIGAVLNRANPTALKKIEAYKGKNYHRYYTSYLHEPT